MIETTYFQTQRELDRESRRLLLEWKYELLPESRREIHDRLNHVPGRCRCLAIEGME